MGFVSVLEYAKKLVREAVQPGDVCVDATVGGGVDTLFLAECVGARGQVHGFDIQAEALERAGRRLDQASICWVFESAGAQRTGSGDGSADALERGSCDRTPDSAHAFKAGLGGWAAESKDALGRGSVDQATEVQVVLRGGSAKDMKGGSFPLPTRVWLHLASHDHMESLVPLGAKRQVAAVMFNLGYLPGSDHRIVTRPDTTVRALGQSLDLLRPGGVLSIVVYTGHPGGLEEEAAILEWIGQRSSAEVDILEYRLHRRDRAAPYLLAFGKKN